MCYGYVNHRQRKHLFLLFLSNPNMKLFGPGMAKWTESTTPDKYINNKIKYKSLGISVCFGHIDQKDRK